MDCKVCVSFWIQKSVGRVVKRPKLSKVVGIFVVTAFVIIIVSLSDYLSVVGL